jgi:hypothetical protein
MPERGLDPWLANLLSNPDNFGTALGVRVPLRLLPDDPNGPYPILLPLRPA